jgi:hypothetical protein
LGGLSRYIDNQTGIIDKDQATYWWTISAHDKDEIPMKYAKIDAATAGSNTVVAAVTGKRILVLLYAITSSANQNAYFASGSTAITGTLYFGNHSNTMAAYGAMTPAGTVGVLRTEIGEALNLVLSASTSLGGHLTYMVTD